MARVWRDGQRQRVYIYRLLMTGSLEERMYQIQIRKQGLSAAVLDDKLAGGVVKFSASELRNLFG